MTKNTALVTDMLNKISSLAAALDVIKFVDVIATKFTLHKSNLDVTLMPFISKNTSFNNKMKQYAR